MHAGNFKSLRLVHVFTDLHMYTAQEESSRIFTSLSSARDPRQRRLRSNLNRSNLNRHTATNSIYFCVCIYIHNNPQMIMYVCMQIATLLPTLCVPSCGAINVCRSCLYFQLSATQTTQSWQCVRNPAFDLSLSKNERCCDQRSAVLSHAWLC